MIYTVKDTEIIQGNLYIYYGESHKIKFEDVGILFSIESMIDIMSLHDPFELRRSHTDWIVIFDFNQVYQSHKGEDLVSFLWRVLKDLSVKNKLE